MLRGQMSSQVVPLGAGTGQSPTLAFGVFGATGRDVQFCHLEKHGERVQGTV